jgi:hypothetical protein
MEYALMQELFYDNFLSFGCNSSSQCSPFICIIVLMLFVQNFQEEEENFAAYFLPKPLEVSNFSVLKACHFHVLCMVKKIIAT